MDRRSWARHKLHGGNGRRSAHDHEHQLTEQSLHASSFHWPSPWSARCT